MRPTTLVLALFLAALARDPAAAQTVSTPFDTDYSLSDLGPITGVPTNYGGLTFRAGDANTLLIGGAANGTSGKLYSIPVVRGANGHVTGFSGTATVYADAAYNDGGVAYGPGNVLFLARYPVAQVGETKPGSVITDKIVGLAPLGVVGTPGGLYFVPSGYPGAGQLKLVTWPGGVWYTLALAADASGTYDITTATQGPTIVGGPEGFIYVPPGSPQFPDFARMLVSEYSAGKIAAYALDANGFPVPATRVDFITGLSGAEGAVIDPLTGDFLFSTFGGGNHVVAVQGFAPPPTSSSTTSTTVTPVTTSSSTSTTQPPSGCEDAPTLASANCRLAALIDVIQASNVPANTKTQLVKRLTKAKARKEAAEAKIAAGKTRPAGNMLKQAVRHLIEFGHKLKTAKGKKDVPSPLRDELLAEGDAIADDLRAVRAGLRTPR